MTQFYKLFTYWVILASLIFKSVNFTPGFLVCLLGTLVMFLDKIRKGRPMSNQFILFQGTVHIIPLILLKTWSFKDTWSNLLVFMVYALFVNPIKVYNDVVNEDDDLSFENLIKSRLNVPNEALSLSLVEVQNLSG
jgi:hypothetical protein